MNKEITTLISESKYNEALALIENEVVNIAKEKGKQSQEFHDIAKQLCDLCNLIAIQLYENDKANEGLDYLIKAENIFSNYKEILNTSLCNLGCYYTLLGNYEKSISYFDKALKLSIELSNKKIAAEIYLNISTVLNKISQYKQSSEQCLNSIVLIQEIITDPSENNSDEELINLFNLLILSYRNLAVQFDCLNDYSNALLYYEISYCHISLIYK